MKKVAKFFLIFPVLMVGLDVAHARIPHQCPRASSGCAHRDAVEHRARGTAVVGAGCICKLYCLVTGAGLPSLR